MNLTVNGEPRSVPSAGATLSVRQLLTALGLADRRVAVELNERIVKRATYDDTPVAEGDVVEVVQFVGGG